MANLLSPQASAVTDENGPSQTSQTSVRPRDVGGSFSSRTRRGAHLSISDTNHHVTEAIGDMYGDDDYGKRDSRPLSFVTSPLSESSETNESYFGNSNRSNLQMHPGRPHAPINGKLPMKSNTLPGSIPSHRDISFDHEPLSPTHSLREKSHGSTDPANQQFPLNDIDYESTPAAVQQELHNLQALRRMSMDVGNSADPDLPSFQGVSLMPSVAPTGGDDEDDPSRLFWVPARVHPELAPMEFKTFLENRVNTIKRRSGDQSSLSPDILDRSGSNGGLRRKKSMLSRQIDNHGGRGAIGYQDGADQLERQKSLSQQRAPELKISDLKELDELVRDPTKAMQKLSLDTGARKDWGSETPGSEDIPILPAAPGIGLRRSTRTAYRRGSLRKGERVPFSERAKRAGRVDIEVDDSPTSSPASSPIGPGALTRVMSEPIQENFSRPNRSARRGLDGPQTGSVSAGGTATYEDSISNADSNPPRSSSVDTSFSPQQNTFPLRVASRSDTTIPQIIETPPQDDEHTSPAAQFPQRTSSQTQQAQYQQDEPPPRSNRRPVLGGRQAPLAPQTIGRNTPAQAPAQTLNDMAQQPSPLPGGSARTDSLTFIPTFTAEKSPEKKGKKEETEATTSRKTSWGWFKGGDDKEKKKKEEEGSKKGKARAVLDKVHDNARLDVLQHSIDTAVIKGRESLLLDRDSVDNKLSEERKKDNSRKSGEGKKEKDGIFSSLFGGGKKKGDRDAAGKKGSSLRAISPELAHRQMRPDIDFNWTRFSILEERAIYRMAHIKLANPRRALYSQVLLSNFMYSYLAKVQQMHPQMQIPQSAQQKKQIEQERRRKEQEEQQRLLEQQQQEDEQYRYDYHQGIANYADQDPQQQQMAEGVNYVDDSQIYDYDHQQPDDSSRHDPNRPQSRASQHDAHNNGYGGQKQYGQQGQQGQQYYPYGSTDSDHRQADRQRDEEEEMW